MAKLLTKTCEYAVIVAIEDGQHFTPQPDRDLFIASRINLKLPRTVDDLIPPSTRLSTTPTSLSNKPHWRTTLIYYVSSQILSRLRKKQSSIILQVNSITEECQRDTLGQVTLQLDQAKIVLMNNGKRDLAQIKQFVVDKGDWLSISKNNRAQIKAGLFIVEMPRSPDTAAYNKDVGTPLQRPLRTAHHHTNGDLGLEICSTNISEFLIASDDDDEEEDMEVQQLDDVTDDEQDVIMNGYRRPSPLRHQHNGIDDDDLASQTDSQQEDQIIGVGEGADSFSFLFRIIEAKCISTLIDDYSHIVAAYFEYTFADRCYQCSANVLDDCWQVAQHNTSAKFQGDAHDILEWISDQEKIRVCLMVENDRGQVVEVGSADIYLKGRDVGVDQQSSIIFDNTHKWHINAKNEFAKVQVQIGLLEGWKDPDFFRPI